jgi:hypothetical protein
MWGESHFSTKVIEMCRRQAFSNLTFEVYSSILSDIVNATIAKRQMSNGQESAMGDKGGKKDKDKGRKQKKSIEERKEKEKQDKQPKKTS